MNFLAILIPDFAIVVCIVLGVLIVIAAALITVLLIKRKKEYSEKKKEAAIAQSTAETPQGMQGKKQEMQEIMQGMLEKTYAPLFENRFRADYQADNYLVVSNNIGCSSEICQVSEEQILMEMRERGESDGFDKKPTSLTEMSQSTDEQTKTQIDKPKRNRSLSHNRSDNQA